jgi:hypothetical protein
VQIETRFDTEFLELFSGIVFLIVKPDPGTLNLFSFRNLSQPSQTNRRGIPSRIAKPIAGATLGIQISRYSAPSGWKN